ncbi:MAG: CYTH and CHAD domain-containing protein [Acidimicrobiales bacterium]
MPDQGPPPSDLEVEWQFDALDLRPVERWLAEVPQTPELTGAVVAIARPAKRLVDTYLDTVDWRLGRSGFVLRVRRKAGGAEVTLKGTTPAVGGLRRRLEVTEPLPREGPQGLSDGPVGWRLRALAGRRPLRDVFEVRTRRRPFELEVDGKAVGEIALDETVIEVANGRPVRLRRVEVEVDPAWEKSLSPLVERLRSECGLQPAALSKFEAGLLASGQRIPGVPELGTTTLSVSPTIGEVAFGVLRRNFAAMLAHEAGTRLGEDREELHDMRVATRRMRAALSMFADALPVRATHVRSELGWVADVLGAVRDLDVQLERVEEWMHEVPEPDRSALGDLRDLLTGQRAEARAALLAALESSRYERLVASFSAMLRQGPSRRVASARAPAFVVVPDLIRARHRAVTKAAKRARSTGQADDFHRLRIRGKRLRYALEFVGPLYDGETTKYVKRIVKLQDSLGLMQDARVAAARLHDLATEEATELSRRTVFVMGGVAERYRHEASQLMGRVPGHLDDVKGPEWHKVVGLMDRKRVEMAALYRWPSAVPAGAASETIPENPPTPRAPAPADAPPAAMDASVPADGAAAEPDQASVLPAPLVNGWRAPGQSAPEA